MQKQTQEHKCLFQYYHPLVSNKVNDVPNLTQNSFLVRMWNFCFERPGLAFNLIMRILVSKTLTSPSAIPPTSWLARAWMANPLKEPQMPLGITEMGLIVQEKDPRKNEGVQKIKMHFHWSWTCKSCTINHSHLKIRINGPECWAPIWFVFVTFGLGISLESAWESVSVRFRPSACCLTPGQQWKEAVEEHVLKYMLRTMAIWGLGRSQKTKHPSSLGENRKLKRDSSRLRRRS